MPGEEDSRRPLGELDHRDAGAHPLDSEDEPRAEHLGEMADVVGNIAARHVDEVELVEEHDPTTVASGR